MNRRRVAMFRRCGKSWAVFASMMFDLRRKFPEMSELIDGLMGAIEEQA